MRLSRLPYSVESLLELFLDVTIFLSFQLTRIFSVLLIIPFTKNYRTISKLSGIFSPKVNSVFSSKDLLARWCSSESVHFAVGRPGVPFPCRVIPKDFKQMVFTASLLGAQHMRDSVENKPASLLVVSLGKAFNGMLPSLCGRQMVGPSSLPVVVAQSDERHANRA